MNAFWWGQGVQVIEVCMGYHGKAIGAQKSWRYEFQRFGNL